MKMGKYINVEKQLVRLYRLGLDNEEVIKQFLLTACEEDVEKVRHGHWIKKYYGNYSCSMCGTWYTTTDDYGTITDDEIWYNYCPNCGARMDGDIE